MTNYTVTITLSEPLYERIRMNAEAVARPVEDILSQFVATTYPLPEDDLPLDMRSEFAGWLLLSDDDLWKIAKRTFEEAKRAALETLIDRQKQQALTDLEQATLEQFLLESQDLMVRKAEAQRLLAQRGIQVYPKPNALN